MRARTLGDKNRKTAGSLEEAHGERTVSVSLGAITKYHRLGGFPTRR